MTDTTQAPRPAAADEDTAVGQTAPKESTPADERTGALEREVADLKDRLLRTLAEMENLRRRTEREVADARTYGVSTFARDVLGVADNVRRALDAIGPDLRADADAQVRSFIEGVELTEQELLRVLEKHGIKRIEAQDQKFDPNVHEAMFEVPDPQKPAGTVVQVMQPGYRIGERVLRPALVGVSSGGPKQAPGTPPANDNPNAS